MTRWDRTTAVDYRQLGPQAHVDVMAPLLRDVFGDLHGARALDFGCGPGRLTAPLAELGADHVLALDENEEMVAEARRTVAAAGDDLVHRVTVRAGDERALPVRPGVEAALCSLALMMCATRERLRVTADGLVRSLAPTGVLLLVVTHPCTRASSFPTFHNEVPDDLDYWASGTPYRAVLASSSGGRTAVVTDHHWTIGDYAGAVAAAGGVIHDLREIPAAMDAEGGPMGPPAYLAYLVGRG